MNNAIRKNNQLLRHQQKYEVSLFAVQILRSKQTKLLIDMFVRSYSTLVKAMELCILTWTWWTHFFDFHEKRKKVNDKFNTHAVSVSPILLHQMELYKPLLKLQTSNWKFRCYIPTCVHNTCHFICYNEISFVLTAITMMFNLWSQHMYYLQLFTCIFKLLLLQPFSAVWPKFYL